jgi:hypothetical protein
MAGSMYQRIVIHVGQDIKGDPLSKITNAERATGMTQVVKSLPSKHEALNSNLSIIIISILTYIGMFSLKLNQNLTVTSTNNIL